MNLLSPISLVAELSEKREEVRKRQESSDKKDAKIARQKAEIEALRRDKEEMSNAKTDARERRASSKEAKMKWTKREEEMKGRGDLVETGVLL